MFSGFVDDALGDGANDANYETDDFSSKIAGQEGDQSISADEGE